MVIYIYTYPWFGDVSTDWLDPQEAVPVGSQPSLGCWCRTKLLLLWIHFSILNCWVALSHHFAPVPSNTARRIRLPAAASWLHWKVNQKCRTPVGRLSQLQEVFFGDFRRNIYENPPVCSIVFPSNLICGFPWISGGRHISFGRIRSGRTWRIFPFPGGWDFLKGKSPSAEQPMPAERVSTPIGGKEVPRLERIATLSSGQSPCWMVTLW